MFNVNGDDVNDGEGSDADDDNDNDHGDDDNDDNDDDDDDGDDDYAQGQRVGDNGCLWIDHGWVGSCLCSCNSHQVNNDDGADDDDNDEDDIVVVVAVVVVVEYDHHNILQEAQGDKSRELRRDFLKSHQKNLSSFCDLSTLIFHCRKSYLIKFSNISF